MREHWKLHGLFLGFFAIGVVPLAFALPGEVRQYAIGAWVASGFWYLVLITVQAAGTSSYMLGAQGEEWTSDALRKLRREGWHLIEDIPLERGDIDHALVGPGGAYAVETKATHGEWSLEEPDERLFRAVEQAREKAKRLHVLLFASPIKLRVKVSPLLVLWGPTTKLQDRINEVDVIHGSLLQNWRQSLPSAALTTEEVQRAVAGLRGFVEMRDKNIRDVKGAPPLIVAIGPYALLVRVLTATFGGFLAVIAIGTALENAGNLSPFALLAVLLTIGATLRRVRSFRVLATGWLAAGALLTVLYVGLHLADWAGLLR